MFTCSEHGGEVNWVMSILHMFIMINTDDSVYRFRETNLLPTFLLRGIFIIYIIGKFKIPRCKIYHFLLRFSFENGGIIEWKLYVNKDVATSVWNLKKAVSFPSLPIWTSRGLWLSHEVHSKQVLIIKKKKQYKSKVLYVLLVPILLSTRPWLRSSTQSTNYS